MNTNIANGQTTANGYGSTPPATSIGGDAPSGTSRLSSTHGKETTRAKTESGGVSKELHNLIADVEQLIVSSTSLTNEDIARMKDKLSSSLTSAREALENSTRTTTEQARKAMTATNQYVTAEPWKAVGIGAGLGLVIGVLLARR